ncbi:MAG: protein kinase [Gemmatimonadaceae bacterium]|nr:protein kinase [Gemmatimonadaceae bacterium]
MSAVAERLTAALADRYRIERELGQGGMATVYLAEDLKHKRRVALKVLKPELAAVLGAERFVQEITTTAALQHPHILPLFDSGEADGFLYYVMPFIDGETLRAKLDRETQLGVDEAVHIATDVADVLHYAHTRGVIHRDIKPENILLANGRPMVADFGIALAVSAAAGGRTTETGLSLGTPHYMSPEQATAEKDISARSDVYSLGSVLYEMLAGQPPHLGGSAQQIIMKIITEPTQPVTTLRKSVPPNVSAALAKALEKVPADRFESAAKFSEALKNSAFTTTTSAQIASGSASWKQRAAVPLLMALLLALGTTGWLWTKRAHPAPVTRLDLAVGTATPLASSDVVISPDGSTLAFVGVLGTDPPTIYVRRLDGDGDFHKVPGTEGANASPTFSPDSRSMAFRRGQTDGTLVRMELKGGTTMNLLHLGVVPGTYLHWGTDDKIVYSGGPKGIYRISATGGTPEFLAKTAAAERYSFLLPDGSGLLFSNAEGVSVLTFATDSVTVLAQHAVHPAYIATGHVLYIAESGGLFAVPFDLRRHVTTGQPFMLLDRVAAAVGQRGYSVSSNGVLVYHEGTPNLRTGGQVPNRLALVDFTGVIAPIQIPSGTYALPRFAPNRGAIAYQVWANRGIDRDIHTFDLATKTDVRLTFADDNTNAVWSPDGTRMLFVKEVGGSNRSDLFVKPADNSGSEQLVHPQVRREVPSDWFRGDTVLFNAIGTGGWDIFTYAMKGGGTPQPYADGAWNETTARVSPDGTLAAFTSSESGSPEIWIRDFPIPKGKWQVSSTSGQGVRWSRDGKYVYYWKSFAAAGDSLFRARIDRTPAVVVRAPEFLLSLAVSGGVENWDLHPDGKRFVVTLPDLPSNPPASTPGAQASRYLVVQNWFTELQAITARAKN